MMKRTTFLALGFCLFTWQSLAAEKIQVAEDVRKILEDNYRAYRENNARKVAEKETRAQMSRPQSLLQNADFVSLPICEPERVPFNWQYVFTNEDHQILKYVGASGGGAQFLKWTDSVWVRISGSKERYREGMYCGQDTFAVVDLDESFSEAIKYKDSRPELTDKTVLQLASKVVVKNARTMAAEVVLAAQSDAPVPVTLEMWSLSNGVLKLLAKTMDFVSPDPYKQSTLKVEAEVDAMHQTFVVARLDNKEVQKGKLFIFGASVGPK